MRLIDADALFPYGTVPYFEDDGFATADKLYGIINNAPTVDAVEVVRCRECAYKVELEGYLVCGDSMRAGMDVDFFERPTYYFDKIVPDDFCSRGRRKDNG